MSAERTLMYEFVSEAKEHLANIGDDLLALEQHKDDSTRYRVDRLFRSVSLLSRTWSRLLRAPDD